MMIVQLDNRSTEVASKLYNIWQASYAVEAQILRATDFPPLNRKKSDFISCQNNFFAHYRDKKIQGVIEILNNSESVHIQSLVVHPDYFRTGIGLKLVQFVLQNQKIKYFTVETGLQNLPAIGLYKSLGFREIKQWDTNHGVRKIRLMLET